MKPLAVVAAFTLASLPGVALAAGRCASALSTEAASRLQTQLFDSFTREDRAEYDRTVTPDFVLIERGKAYAGGEAFDLVQALHRKGLVAHWRVTAPHLQSDCDLAVMRYVNDGDIGTGAQPPTPTQWLETAAFRRDDGRWRVVLVTSERVGTEAPAAAPAAGLTPPR